jgi:hypothetical protein
LALPLVLAGCRDIGAPDIAQNGSPLQPTLARGATGEPTPSASVHILQQAATAPPLQTYQVSFWAYKGVASTVTVDYQPAPGEANGRPFLRFAIPKNGLVAGADGGDLQRGDSVYVTLSVDPVAFSVHFRPAGVLFSKSFPAILTLWYGNANPDFDDDGVVNDTDQQLAQQLAVWYHAAKTRWSKLSSLNDPGQTLVSAPLYHFSEYAVSW